MEAGFVNLHTFFREIPQIVFAVFSPPQANRIYPIKAEGNEGQTMSLSTKVQRGIFRASPYKIRELILFYAANQLPLQCFNPD